MDPLYILLIGILVIITLFGLPPVIDDYRRRNQK
jgi:hypothetical protein